MTRPQGPHDAGVPRGARADGPGPDDPIEAALRAALSREAASITPGDRLAEIRSRATAPVAPRRSWLLALGSAAAVGAIVVGGIAAANRPWAPPGGGVGASTPGQSSSSLVTSAASPPSSETASASVTSRTSGSSSSTSAGGPVALPAYVLVRIATDDGEHWRLGRTFLSVGLPGSDTPAARVQAALEYAIGPGTRVDGLPSPWGSVGIVDVSATPDLITVTLSGPGSQLTDPAEAELALMARQVLVWTAQAAYGRGRVPVTFRVEQQTQVLLGRYPAGAAYDRPNSDAILTELAPVLLTRPGPGPITPGDTIPVTGVAAVPEGQLVWWVTDLASGAEVARGTAIADQDPGAGTSPLERGFGFDLAGLPAGTYRLSVGYPSAKDGSTLGVVTTMLDVFAEG